MQSSTRGARHAANQRMVRNSKLLLHARSHAASLPLFRKSATWNCSLRRHLSHTHFYRRGTYFLFQPISAMARASWDLNYHTKMTPYRIPTNEIPSARKLKRHTETNLGCSCLHQRNAHQPNLTVPSDGPARTRPHTCHTPATTCAAAHAKSQEIVRY